jgi:hypothetical protein
MLHLQSYKHYRSAVKSALNYVKEVHEMEARFNYFSVLYSIFKKDHPRSRSINQAYQACVRAGKHALNFAESDPPVDYLGIFEEESGD